MNDVLNKEKSGQVSEIPRRSKFKLNSNERKRLLKDCWDEISEGIGENEKVSLSQDIVDGLIGPLYEDIGHLDYRMYYNVDDDISDEQKLENIKAYLVNRAYKSAMLEAFEDEANKNGFIIKKKFKLKDTTSEELRNRYGDEICHGTVAEVKPEELGEVDENGKYKIRDGILYFTQRERAEKFVNKMKNSRPDITQEPWIYARDISQSYKDNECVKLDNGILTTGWTGYLYQDEIKQLCEEGKKYVFSATPQILDIHNFAKFVEERDTAILEALEKYKLRLPYTKESLTEYITVLEITEQQFEDIISAEKKRANEQRWNTGKVLPNNKGVKQQQSNVQKVAQERTIRSMVISALSTKRGDNNYSTEESFHIAEGVVHENDNELDKINKWSPNL